MPGTDWIGDQHGIPQQQFCLAVSICLFLGHRGMVLDRIPEFLWLKIGCLHMIKLDGSHRLQM